MKTLTALTENQIKSVNTEILNCEKMKLKELNYSEDLRNNDRINKLENHILHLKNMLQNGWNAPKFN